MDYQDAITACGAKIIAFEQFGSYQGDWWAKVEYEGNIGWITGSYGSCTGCDAFQAEFGYTYDPTPEQLNNFGKQYLEEIYTKDEALAKAKENNGWDAEAKLMVNFIEIN